MELKNDEKKTYWVPTQEEARLIGMALAHYVGYWYKNTKLDIKRREQLAKLRDEVEEKWL